MKEFTWHQEALHSWLLNDCKGTAECATGSGKTRFAIKAIKEVDPLTVLITVNTLHLQNQWFKQLVEEFGKEKVGLVGGGKKELDKPIIIAVVNSLWKMTLKKDMLVADEVHHASSIKNIAFFKRSMFGKVLGLTATYDRSDERHKLFDLIAPVIFLYNQERAIQDKVLSCFNVVNISLSLLEEEQIKFNKFQNIIDILYPLFHNDYKEVHKGLCGIYSKEAADTLRAFNDRKFLLANAQSKADECVSIILDNVTYEGSKIIIPKTIIFCEYIDMAEKVKEVLNNKGYQCAIYHSMMKLKERKKMLQDFKEDEFRIMVSAKALDEGVDCPNASIGIWCSGSQQKRQVVQRLGRILRSYEGKKAILYHLYIKNTSDEWSARKRVKEFEGVAKEIKWQ